MGDRPKHRFGKRSNKRYKAVRKIVEGIDAPECHTLITGRTEGFKDHVYVEVLHVDFLGGYRVYFDRKATKKEIKREVRHMIKELGPV